MRLCAVSPSQLSVATCSMSVWPDFTTSVPSSISGWSTSMAPSKKKNALLSSSEPANSSMLKGPRRAVDRRAVEPGEAEAVQHRPRLLLADDEVVE